MNKLLTPEQAADYLAISPLTLAHWRDIRKGPSFVILGQNEDLTQGRKRATRYRLSDLDAFITSRTHDPAARTPRPARRMAPRRLTDAEWAVAAPAIHEALTRHGGPATVSNRHRALLDAALDAATTGAWPEPSGNSLSPRHRLRKGVRPGGWVVAAFEALTAFPGFPFLLACHWSVVRRGRRRDLPQKAASLRTDAYGPLQSRARRRVGDIA